MGQSLKKVTRGSSGTKRNPVTPSKLTKATKLYQEFTGHAVDIVDLVDVDPITHGLTIGECDGILYTTIRDGETESYIHRFKKSARPTLVASHDGEQLALIGGNFNFTDRGIVDN